VVNRLTLATASGLPLLVLAFHVTTGLVAIVAGFTAIAARKGGAWHRRSGLAFVYAMLATAVAVVGVSLYEGKPDSTGGVLIAYFVLTAWTTVRPIPGISPSPRVDIALMVLALTLAANGYHWGFLALDAPGNQLDGVPAGMMFFMSTITLLAAIGDARMIHAGGLQGSRRLARHLWRMSYGLFIASGSFFIGQMKFVPKPIRSVPVLMLIGISPLIILLYWMWRIRLRQNLRGVVTLKPIAASTSR